MKTLFQNTFTSHCPISFPSLNFSLLIRITNEFTFTHSLTNLLKTIWSSPPNSEFLINSPVTQHLSPKIKLNRTKTVKSSTIFFGENFAYESRIFFLFLLSTHFQKIHSIERARKFKRKGKRHFPSSVNI